MIIGITERTKSIITGRENLELLFNLEHFPVFMGCTSASPEEDLFADMTWMIDRDSGMIQLKNLLPLDLVYSGYHSEALGSVWTKHHIAFCDFIKKYSTGDVLEVGGGNGALALEYTKSGSQKWTIVEAQSLFPGNENVRVIKAFFDTDFLAKEKDLEFNTVVHSHVMEHIVEPNSFLGSIWKSLPNRGRHIFSIPNLEVWLKKMNHAIHFEHTLFLTEAMMDFLLLKNGFSILHKEYLDEHSIFYDTEKSFPMFDVPFKNRYFDYKRIYLDLINYYQAEIRKLNTLIEQSTIPVFLFGAHIFSQYLLGMGLHVEKICAVLDNSVMKQGKRLYGTPLYVRSPECLKTMGSACVILKAGEYQSEIKKQIELLNPNVEIWE